MKIAASSSTHTEEGGTTCCPGCGRQQVTRSLTLSQYQLAEVQLAEKYGAKCQEDLKRGKGWFSFRLHGWHIWTVRDWVAARITPVKIKGVVCQKYSDHHHSPTLEEALQYAVREQGSPGGLLG